ncbi:hypothetical protein BDC45DRAFT_420592, partial [Circinella umbellata]
LPGVHSKTCSRYTTYCSTKKHAIQCLHIHHRLKVAGQHDDPISHIFNQLPKRRPTSTRKKQYLSTIWPTVCKILAELDAYNH